MNRRRVSFLSLLAALSAFTATPAVSAELIRGTGSHVEYFHVDRGGNATRTSGVGFICPPGNIYQNEDQTYNFVAISQNGDEWADDVHFGSTGTLTGFGVGFIGSANDSFDVTLALYAWSGDNVAPGSAIMGPWTFRVPNNTIGVGVFFAPGPIVGPDAWIGASFSDPTVGLALHDPPQIGTSDDLYWNLSTGMQGGFGGKAVANFISQVTVCRLRSSAFRESEPGGKIRR